MQRSTARFLEHLDQARRGEGDDPRCNQALALLETNLTGATQRIMRQAHVLRHEMAATRLRTEQAQAQAPTPEPAATPLDSARVETDQAAPVASVAQQLQPVDTPSQELLLALAPERTSSSPLARGLGAPTSTWSIDGSDVVVEGWNSTSDLFAVRDPNRQLLGWVEALGDGWGTYIQGRLIIDATDSDPRLSTDAPHAIALLRAARNQQLT